jgi:hypothetical protein
MGVRKRTKESLARLGAKTVDRPNRLRQNR